MRLLTGEEIQEALAQEFNIDHNPSIFRASRGEHAVAAAQDAKTAAAMQVELDALQNALLEEGTERQMAMAAWHDATEELTTLREKGQTLAKAGRKLSSEGKNPFSLRAWRAALEAWNEDP